MKLDINTETCTGCKLCETVCIRDNIEIDEVAEHILSIGGQPLGTLKDYLTTSKITEAENKKVDATLVFNEIIKDFTTLLKCVVEIKELVLRPFSILYMKR